ncbi:MAG: InlB B-repeat-containing protein, partial [Lachnospiraceae bacterium]|nr:InlB B-repeat-containing protein [Lachnospiraceae bacterium]
MIYIIILLALLNPFSNIMARANTITTESNVATEQAISDYTITLKNLSKSEECTYYYDNNEDTILPSDTYATTGCAVTELEKDGYTFSGWYDNPYFKGDTYTYIPRNTNKNLIFYAKWELTNYKLYLKNQEEETLYINFTCLSTITLPINMKMENYIFLGWYNEETEEKIEKIPKGTCKDIYVYAKWEPLKYNIIFERDGGKFESEPDYFYVYNQEYILPINIVKEGCTFMGWLSDNILYEKIEKKETGDKIFWAQWKKQIYKINYTSEEKSPGKEEYEYGEDYILPTLQKDGYTFLGWLWKDKLITTTKGLYEDLDLSASWVISTYDITYNIDKKVVTLENPVYSYTYNDYVTLPIPKREGYIFNGWSTSEKDVIFNIPTGSSINYSLTPTWIPEEYSIYYNLTDGETLEEGYKTKRTYGISLTLPTPTKYGYNFIGWHKEEDLSDESFSTIKHNVVGDLNLYPEWEPKEFTYSIDYMGGIGEIAQKKVKFNDKLTFLSELSAQKTGYKLNGYYITNEDNTTTSVNTETIIETEGDKTVSLIWDINQYKLIFDAMSGNCEEKERAIVYGQKIGALPTATKEGYTFTGWYYNNKLVKDTDITLTQDTTFYARYSKNAISQTTEKPNVLPTATSSYIIIPATPTVSATPIASETPIVNNNSSKNNTNNYSTDKPGTTETTST